MHIKSEEARVLFCAAKDTDDVFIMYESMCKDEK